ncbi:tryptophan 2,3-dioxygenase family protein [Saccharothrix sp. Mg75]|uniref:tryptophan 2,3-dioxygenase family protein n=1 Tax=Saccharothrix sp. Mg75 TaxID=3445357 RepID=UPI003EED337C
MNPVVDEDLDYRRYLELDALLSLQRPRVAGRETDRVRLAEHFFIVVHQTSELWLRQLLLDLDLGVDALRAARPRLAAEHLLRVGRVFDLLRSHIDVLDRLPADCFARFRPYLGTASGAQSEQFADVERALGFGRGPAPVLEALHAATAGTTLAEACRRDPAYRQVVDALHDIAACYRRWKTAHLECVHRLVGAHRGTGGTTGADYLAARVRSPFPDLPT